MRNWKPWALVGAMTLLTACTNSKSTADDIEQAQTPQQSFSTDGVWQSDGFGYVMLIDDGKVRFFHATPDICIDTENDGLVLEDVFEKFRQDTPDRLYMSSNTEPFEIRFDRVERLPLACEAKIGGSVEETVDAIISFFTHHYAFFNERDLDWQKLASEFRAETTNVSDERVLYDKLVSLLSKTNDAHVELVASIANEDFRFDADPGLRRRYIALNAEKSGQSVRDERRAFDQEFWVNGIGQEILSGNSFSAANDRIRYGVIDGQIGYVAIKSMGGYVSENSNDGDTEEQVLDNVMDRAIELFDQARARAVIVDVSINSGGYEYIARRLAGRFFEETHRVYDKYAGDAVDQTPQPHFVGPVGRSQFIGPVYVLSSSETVSAAEAFVMAMRARPDVTQIGATTRGALSTKLAKLLPNGWEMTLSNEVVRDHEGIIWEGKGIPPKVSVDIFPDRNIDDATLLGVDFISAHQAAVDDVVALIKERHEMK